MENHTKEEIFEDAKEIIRKRNPALSDIDVEIELAKQLEDNARINRAYIELQADGSLEGLSLSEQVIAINKQAYSDAAEQIREEQNKRKIFSELREQRRTVQN